MNNIFAKLVKQNLREVGVSRLSIIVALSLAVLSCSKDAASGGHWDAIDPYSDSLTMVLEKNRYDLSEAQRGVMDSLKSRAQVTKDPRLICRMNYWLAQYYYNIKDAVAAYKYSLLAERQAETASLSAYDRLRINNIGTQLRAHRESQYYELFADLTSQTEQFGSFGDSLKMADCLNSIGALLGSIGSPDLAQGYFQRAADIYQRHNALTGLAHAWYNLANCKLIKGHTDEARRCFRVLERSPHAVVSPDFHVNVLTALTLTYRDFQPDSIAEYVVTIDSLIKDMPENATRVSGELAIADYLNMKGAHKDAIDAVVPAARFYKENGMISEYRSTLKLLSSAYLGAGMLDSVCTTLIEYVGVSEAIDSISRHNEIVNRESAMRIERMKTEMQWDHERQRSRLVTLVLVIVFCLIASGALIVLLWSKRRILRERLYIRELENEQLQLKKAVCERRIIADTIQIESTRNILKSVGSNDIRIRAQLAEDEGWEAFKTTFEELHPNFYKRLREVSNILTEYDIRLSSYIAVGIGNKQIARMLNVLPESVKKSRTRLRKKLGLQSGESLENFLRNLAN